MIEMDTPRNYERVTCLCCSHCFCFPLSLTMCFPDHFFRSLMYAIFPLQALPHLLSSLNTHCTLSPLHSLHYLTTPRVNTTSHLLFKSHIFSCNEPHKQPYPFCGKRIFHLCLTVQWLWKKIRVLLFSKTYGICIIQA